MTLLVVGAGGQLGRALQRLRPDARYVDRPDVDLASQASVDGLPWDGVSGVVNAAAYTAVDAAEGDPATAWAVNATGVAHLARHARRLDVPLVQISTDYVFAGDATAPISVEAPLAPRSVYGATKAAGEMAARLAPRSLVVRTSWLFGDGPNFVRTMLRLARERDEVTVVDDQVGRPTYAVDLAAAVLHLLDRGASTGTVHVTGAGDVVSWAAFAEAVLAGTGCRVVATTTEAYGAPAPRPAYSALDLATAEAAGVRVRDWRDALVEYLEES